MNDVEAPAQQRAPAFTVTRDGPYTVVGAIPLSGQATDAIGAMECYALCRCGGSKNKPFCDGTHWSIGFHDDKN